MPVSKITPYFPKLMYQRYFDEKTDEAIEELGKDVRRSLRATHRTIKNPPPSGFLTSKDAYLNAYAEHEVPNPVFNWYNNSGPAIDPSHYLLDS